MPRGIIKSELIKKDPVTAVYQLKNICTICGAVYESGNVYTSKYCKNCLKEVKRQQTKERVKKYRKNLKSIAK